MKNRASTKRFSDPPFRGQKGRCAWCGTTDLPKGRRSWCSQACVDEYLMVSSPEHIRQQLQKRDHGICAICGRDADSEYRAWREARKESARLADWLSGRRWPPLDPLPSYAERRKFRDYLADKYAPGRWTPGRRSGWDADHIVPVVEGGGECGLDNYRTLCHPCHKKETAKLARRRAQSNKSTQQPDLL